MSLELLYTYPPSGLYTEKHSRPHFRIIGLIFLLCISRLCFSYLFQKFLGHVVVRVLVCRGHEHVSQGLKVCKHIRHDTACWVVQLSQHQPKAVSLGVEELAGNQATWRNPHNLPGVCNMDLSVRELLAISTMELGILERPKHPRQGEVMTGCPTLCCAPVHPLAERHDHHQIAAFADYIQASSRQSFVPNCTHGARGHTPPQCLKQIDKYA